MCLSTDNNFLKKEGMHDKHKEKQIHFLPFGDLNYPHRWLQIGIFKLRNTNQEDRSGWK